jgi:hypothetical protein
VVGHFTKTELVSDSKALAGRASHWVGEWPLSCTDQSKEAVELHNGSCQLPIGDHSPNVLRVPLFSAKRTKTTWDYAG